MADINTLNGSSTTTTVAAQAAAVVANNVADNNVVTNANVVSDTTNEQEMHVDVEMNNDGSVNNLIDLNANKHNDNVLNSDTEMNDTGKTRRVRIYPAGHKGPYYVYIRATRETHLRHLALSKHLYGKHPKGAVLRITQMNNYKLRVEFSNAAAANNLVQCTDDIFIPYRVYISAEQVEVEGVVYLSVEDCESDLLKYGTGQFREVKIPEVELIDVYRFQKIQRDPNRVMIGKTPTPLVRVTFPGSVLPSRVVLDGLLLPVQPYRKKAMLCENCLHTGHTKAFCVVKPKCAKCGSQHNTRDCQLKEKSNKCFVCGTNHNPEERSKCPKISQATTHKNQQMKKKLSLSYAEALKNYVQTSNEFELLSSDDEDLEETSEIQLQD